MKYTQQATLIGGGAAGEQVGPSANYSGSSVGVPPGPLVDTVLEADTFTDAGPHVMTADLVEATPGKLGIRVADVGSPGIPIQWKAFFFIFGTQVKA